MASPSALSLKIPAWSVLVAFCVGLLTTLLLTQPSLANPQTLLIIGLILAGLVASAALGSFITTRFSSSATSSGKSRETEKTGELMGLELHKILSTIRSRLVSHDSYTASLVAVQKRLEDLPTAEQVRVIVTLLLDENNRMRLDTQSMSKELEQARQRIELLGSRLEKATEAGLQDPLTTVGNRRNFDLKLAQAIQHSSASKAPLSIIMTDVDNFKKVNDEFGHQIGDEVLKYFAQLLASSVRSTDTVTRYGGEEFAIILPGATSKAAENIAENIRKKLSSKNLTIRKTSQVIGLITASFGVSEFRDGETADQLIERIDAKLYEAKKSGRDRVAAD